MFFFNVRNVSLISGEIPYGNNCTLIDVIELVKMRFERDIKVTFGKLGDVPLSDKLLPLTPM